MVSKPEPRHQENLQPAMNETIAYLPGLSPVAGKELCARFDGGRLSSDGGVLLLREIERRLGIADSRFPRHKGAALRPGWLAGFTRGGYPELVTARRKHGGGRRLSC